MPRMTVHVPDKMLSEFRERHPETNVAEVVRQSILRKLEELERFEEFKRKGVL